MPNTSFAMPEIDALSAQIASLLADPATTHGLARALRATAKEVDLHRHHQMSQSAWPDGRIDDKPARVQVGGGQHRIDGFFNIDIVPPADLVGDVREGIPLHDGSVDVIFSEHFLEHVDYPRSAKHYAAEALRVLAPGGELITGVPDAAFVLNRYPSPPDRCNEMIERWYSKRARPALHGGRLPRSRPVALRRHHGQPEAGVGQHLRHREEVAPPSVHRWGVVIGQHLRGPGRLTDFTPSTHRGKPRLDVEDGRTVHGIQLFHVEVQAVDLQ